MKLQRRQSSNEIAREVEIRFLGDSTVTSVPHGRGSGLIDALVLATSPALAQRRLAVIDPQNLGSSSSMFDYDYVTALPLEVCPL